MSEIKLTPVQNKVIWCLQNGWILITDSGMKGAIVGATTKDQFKINNRVFWNLVDKGMIYQSLEWPFHYVLTKEGKSIKTIKPKYP
jgi:hypothetical protein